MTAILPTAAGDEPCAAALQEKNRASDSGNGESVPATFGARRLIRGKSGLASCRAHNFRAPIPGTNITKPGCLVDD